MRFIDWFAGIGGFRRGMELMGHECVGFCEFDKYAVMSYTAMHLCTQEQLDYLATLPLKERQKEILKEEYRNGEWYAKDVTAVRAEDIPRADCWCFGFPCQDISVAGLQKGLSDGKRSSLFFTIMGLIEQLKEEDRPSYLFIENVKNLLSIGGGWDFAKVLIALDEAGYDAEWSVLNSKDFGVPQNRERAFIIGHLRGRSTTEVFPVEGTDGADYIYGVRQIGQLYGTEKEVNPSGGRVYDSEGQMRTLGAGCGMSKPLIGCDVSHENEAAIKLIGHRNGYHRNSQVFAPDGITETLDTAAGGGRGHHTIEVVAHTRDTAVKDRTRVLSDGGISQCLRSTDYKDPVKVATPISFANGQIQKEIETAHCLSAEGPAKEGMRTHQPANRVMVELDTNDKGYERIGQIPYENGRTSARTGVYDADSGVPAQTATQAKDPYRVAIPVITPDRAEKRQNGRRFKEDGDEAFTLTAQDRHGVAVDVPIRNGLQEHQQWRDDGISPALTAAMGMGGGYTPVVQQKIAADPEDHREIPTHEIGIMPVEMSGHRLSESDDLAHTLNCTDQQKVFGANQVHTMVGYNATAKSGGGVTETAHTLMARDYKGPGNQMMTMAAICLPSTKDTGQRNGTSRTASSQGKTGGSADADRKEL